MGTGERARRLVVGIDGHGGERPILNALDLHIAKAEHGEMGRIGFCFAAFAEVGDLLEGRFPAAAICHGESAACVQSFAVLQMDALARLGIAQRHAYIARNILAEICHQRPGAVPEQAALKLFFFPHRHALVFNQRPLCILLTQNGSLPVAGGAAGIVLLAALQIGRKDGSCAHFKIRVGDNGLHRAIGVG